MKNKMFESYKTVRKFTTKTPQVFKSKKQYNRKSKHKYNKELFLIERKEEILRKTYLN